MTHKNVVLIKSWWQICLFRLFRWCAVGERPYWPCWRPLSMIPWLTGLLGGRWALLVQCMEEEANKLKISRARLRWKETSHAPSSLLEWLRLRWELRAGLLNGFNSSIIHLLNRILLCEANLLWMDSYFQDHFFPQMSLIKVSINLIYFDSIEKILN